MSVKGDGKQNTESAQVLQLGFNISVSGDPGTNFQIVLDDSEQKSVHSTSQNETDFSSLGFLPKTRFTAETSKKELEIDTEEVNLVDDETEEVLKSSENTSSKINQKTESSSNKESNILNEIKCTLEHFEKFSNHLKDVRRLRGHPIPTSTPLSDKSNSKSESNLIHSQFRPRRFSHLYDYHYNKNYYFQKPVKSDIFLKPLPGENLYRSGFYTRYKSDSLRHYVSDGSLDKTSDFKAVCEKSKYEDLNMDTPGILKKFDSESGDKQSTSSAESIKDIKIYQSGGILIMQNFKENMDAFEKKEISNFSAKLIENCCKLKEEVNSFQGSNLKGVGFSSDEGRSPGKVVQFDLPGFENQKSKSNDSSFSASKDEKLSLKQESSDSITDSIKIKDSSPQGASQSQEFLSLSTVENDSTISNQFGLSPTYSSTKKLEWDSGADVGYYNSDLSKENLSTIEKYVLSHLSSDNHENNRSVQPSFSKFAHVRIASDKLIDDIREERRKKQQELTIIEKKGSCKRDDEIVELSDDESVKNAEVTASKESTHSKLEKPVNEISIQESFRLEPKRVELLDKSMNVNTLFENVNLNPSRRTITSDCIKNVDSSNKKSPKVRKFKKTKLSRKIASTTPKRRFSIENPDENYEIPIFEMSFPKRTFKKSNENQEIRDVELSREVEEIVIDQRFKIKQNVSGGKEIKKLSTAPDEKEVKSLRPVSGSSSSNNTVLLNIEKKETENVDVSKANEFSDQIIQTSDLDYESVGVQAFESRKSSDCSSRTRVEEQKAQKKTNNVVLSSKNIQAFGLNASLPKELAHVKETSFPENQYTKSTQYFGGPINSLPNYHSSLITKPGESCGRVQKVLNTKKREEAEMMRLNEENKKNILTSDSLPINSKRNSDKNKENKFPKNSKRSHGSASIKNKDACSSEKKDFEDSNLKSEKYSSLMEGPDYVHTSDEVSSKVLTSEVLKEHGDSIDRNIIQEKYFQSQLMELKKKEMISRSTSMDSQIERGRVEKECVTVGCQYSSLSRDLTSEEETKDKVPEVKHIEQSKQKSQRTETTDQYDSSQNNMEEELLCTSKSSNQEQITNGSLPSSSQTVHSWIPGVQDPKQDKGGVGRTRSFEYLPGHIYERNEVLSGTEQNSVTSGSTGKHSVTKGGSDSQGRNTLILKNRMDNSHESNQLKTLDENLTQLNLVVTKLWEKEAAVKNLSQSLFLNLWRKNGSGDNIGPIDALQSEVLDKKKFAEHGKEGGDATSELSPHVEKKTKEISTEYQTEEKSSPECEKFHQRRRVLEKRISEEKQNQIKWIENEIHHLNMLRGLLEKQNSSYQRNKRYSVTSEIQSGVSKNETEKSIHNAKENCSGPVTPVYGCTISLDKNSSPVDNSPVSERNSFQGSPANVNEANSDPVLYGMSVSVRNVALDAIKNLQRIVTLPVGVQISFKNSDSSKERLNSEGESEKIIIKSRTVSSGENNLLIESLPCEYARRPQSEAYTQFPSSRENSPNLPSTSMQIDFSMGKCKQCRRQSCFCLSLSDRSMQSASPASKISDTRESLKLSIQNEEHMTENKTSSSTDPELLEIRSCPSPKLLKQNKILVKSNTKSPSSESFPKSKCTHKKECKKHLEREHSQIKSGIQGIVCRNPCQSNATSNSEKSVDFPSCRCSKIQVQKFSTCACHVIKIMENQFPVKSGSCQCRKGILKKTENQSCQTDEVTIVTKDLIDNPQLIKASRGQDVEYLCEQKIVTEKKRAILQKLPTDQKVSYEKRSTYDKKLEIQEKVGVVKRSPEVDVSIKNKTLEAIQLVGSCEKGAEKKGMKIVEKVVEYSEDVQVDTKALQTDHTCTCFEACQKKMNKNDALNEALQDETSGKNYRFEALRGTSAGKNDNHPRHYFLKLEETEIDDSEESLEMKNSLEVITVKIPVKKAGKAKVHNLKCPKSYQTNQRSKHFGKETSFQKSCYCCQACSGYSSKSTEYSGNIECRRIQAEKPQSPIRFRDPHPTPVTSLEDMRYQYKYDNHQRYEKSFPPYCNRSTGSQDSAPKADIQVENDHYKKCSCNFKPDTEFNPYEPVENLGRQEKVQSKLCCDIDEIELNDQKRPCKPQNNDNDYYNYDRVEYKTKSELLKEEKKRKTRHHPLQEYLCRNRPDFYNTAERRRQIIAKKAKERTAKHDYRMECLMSLKHSCQESDRSGSGGEKRIFTTSEMRGQTMKRYKNLPEVTGKIADRKKKEEYRTNKIVADIYSKKLQIEALKGHLNLSNSVSVLATI